MKKWIIRTFGLKGSWKWAKRQMLKGKMVRCKHWSGALKYKIDSPENGLMLSDYSRSIMQCEWRSSNHHLKYEDFTDYEVFYWDYQIKKSN
jgi:hypothetical protein